MYRETYLIFLQDADGILGVGLDANSTLLCYKESYKIFIEPAESYPTSLMDAHSGTFSLCFGQYGGLLGFGGFSSKLLNDPSYTRYTNVDDEYSIMINEITVS